MTYEEAKTIIENAVYNYRPIGNTMNAFKMAIESLEKQQGVDCNKCINEWCSICKHNPGLVDFYSEEE